MPVGAEASDGEACLPARWRRHGRSILPITGFANCQCLWEEELFAEIGFRPSRFMLCRVAETESNWTILTLVSSPMNGRFRSCHEDDVFGHRDSSPLDTRRQHAR